MPRPPWTRVEVDALLAKHGSAYAAAEAAGITRQRLSQIMRALGYPAREGGRKPERDSARPAFDLTPADIAALKALQPPYPEPLAARIRAVLATWWRLPERPALAIPAVRGATTPVAVRLDGKALRRLDRERGEASRGAFLRAVVEVLKKVSKGA